MPFRGLLQYCYKCFQNLRNPVTNIETALIAIMVGMWPRNFVGTLLVLILIDPDHFPLDSEGFKNFIFVQFAYSMNHAVFFIVLVVADLIRHDYVTLLRNSLVTNFFQNLGYMFCGAKSKCFVNT